MFISGFFQTVLCVCVCLSCVCNRRFDFQINSKRVNARTNSTPTQHRCTTPPTCIVCKILAALVVCLRLTTGGHCCLSGSCGESLSESICIFSQASSMDVKNMWVSEIRKVLTGQLEACKGAFLSHQGSGVRGHSPSHCTTTQSKPRKAVSNLPACILKEVITEVDVVGCGASYLHFINIFVRINP